MIKDDDTLDGCAVEVPTSAVTEDDDVDALVLFADTDFLDPHAVMAKSAAYRAMFG